MNLKKTKKYIIGTFLVLAAFAMQLMSPVIIQAQKQSERNRSIGMEQILQEFARQGTERHLTPHLSSTLSILIFENRTQSS